MRRRESIMTRLGRIKQESQRNLNSVQPKVLKHRIIFDRTGIPGFFAIYVELNRAELCKKCRHRPSPLFSISKIHD